METTAGPARHPKKEIGSATKNAKNRKNEKVSAPAAVDVTDTVAMLTPFITEVDLWPAATQSGGALGWRSPAQVPRRSAQ